MKTVTVSPRSVNSRNPMEETESNYYPGCRKDANCNCQICLDSINATLDLMPMSVQKTSLTRLKPTPTPLSFNATLLSTPISSITPTSRNPVRVPKSTPTPKGKSRSRFCLAEKNNRWCFGVLKNLRWVLMLGFVSGFLWFPWEWSGVLRPRLYGEIVKSIVVVDDDFGRMSLSERLMLVQNGLRNFVEHVSSCNSTWKINQDSLILKSECVLYKSGAEEVIVWGWPLQTAGVITAGFSSSTFIMLSGRLTEWPEGSIGSGVVRDAERNSSWVLRKWSASAVQLDPDTWIVEYKRNILLENPSSFLAVVDLFKYRFIGRMKRKLRLWLLEPTQRWRFPLSQQHSLKIPT